MSQFNHHSHKAFSLIEMSVVIVVLSILMLVALKGRSLVYDSRVSGAAYLTNSSIVTAINGLEAWYETTLPDSLNPYEKFEGKSITKWYDIDPTSGTVKNNLVQNGSSGVPNYQKKCINNLPCLNFSGSGEYLIAENEIMIKGDSAQGTIFLVGATYSSTYDNDALAISGGSDKTVMRFDLNSGSNTSGFRFRGSARIFANPFKYGVPFISTWTFSRADLAQYFDLYVNGVKQNQSSLANDPLDLKNNFVSVGAHNYSNSYISFYNGKISEIIIFNKYLTDEERSSVERYLSKKFAIKLN